MAKLPPLITAAVFGIKRCLCVPQSQGVDLKHIMGSFVGVGKETVKISLNPFFPTLSCLGQKVSVLAVRAQLFLSLFCESGYTVMQLKTRTPFSCFAQAVSLTGKQTAGRTSSGLRLFDEPGRAELVRWNQGELQFLY